MRSKASFYRIFIPSMGMLVLILDSKTALLGVSEGIGICIRTVIPSLFPFFVLSILLTGAMGSGGFSLLKPLGRICGVPGGMEGLIPLGLLGGYPVGAQAAAQAYAEARISKEQAHRLLGFCSNCGPAFLFGIAGSLFSQPGKAWVLWGVHILSAILVGILLPEKKRVHCQASKGNPPDLPEAMNRAIGITASVCGWILLSRCLLSFLERWFLWAFSAEVQAIAAGILELANGCLALHHVENEATRFLLASGLLGFGGLCVGMQTVSVTGTLGTGWYFPGKLLQMSLSLSLSALLLPLLYPGSHIHWAAFLTLLPAFAILLIKKKKEVAFSGKLVYNV